MNDEQKLAFTRELDENLTDILNEALVSNTAANKNILNREHKTLIRIMSKVRKEIFRGDMTKITSEKDMSRLTKYAKNGKMKEVGLLKDATRNLATSLEAAIDALCKAPFPDARNMTSECVSDYIRTSNQGIGAKSPKTYNWITA